MKEIRHKFDSDWLKEFHFLHTVGAALIIHDNKDFKRFSFITLLAIKTFVTLAAVKRQVIFSHLSKFERGMILELRELENPFREIGNRTGRKASTVLRTWNDGLQRTLRHRGTGERL